MNRSAQPGISSTVGGVSLDTSGYVSLPGWPLRTYSFSCLSLFERGYGGAMARELYDRLISEGMTHEAASLAVAFRNWAPETLAAIRKDCAGYAVRYGVSAHHSAGRRFWEFRQAGNYPAGFDWPHFPPLTVTLGDDGKVRLSEAAGPAIGPPHRLDAPNILPLQGVDRDHSPASTNLGGDGGSAATEGQSQAEGGGDVG